MKQLLILICLFLSCTAPTFSTKFTLDEIKKCYEDYKLQFKNYCRPTDFNITQKGSTSFDGGTFDYIVIGAGSAGISLANTLSRNGRVLLLSQGSDASKCSLIPNFQKYLKFSSGSIGLQSAANTQCFRGLVDNKINIDRSSNAGGFSTSDEMEYYKIALDEIKILEKFNKLWPPKLREEMRLMESADIHISDDSSSSSSSDDDLKCHGQDGILSTVLDNFQSPAANELLRSSGKCQVDLNCGNILGCSKLQVMSKNGIRLNLLDNFNINTNSRITLRKNAFVTKIKLDSTRRPDCKYIARGVYYVKDGKLFRAKANVAVVLSGGSIFSSMILLKSGIGKCTDLAAKNIPCSLDLPVGQNQVDKPQVRIFLKTDCKQKPDISNCVINQFLFNGTGTLSSPGQQGTCYVNLRNENSRPDVQYTIRHITADNLFAQSLNLKPDVAKKWFENCKPNCYMVKITCLKSKAQVSTTLNPSNNPFAFPIVRYSCSKDDRDTLVRAILHFKYNIAPHFSTCKVEVPVQIPSLCDSCDDEDCVRKFVENTMTFKGDISGGCNMGNVTDANGKVKGTCNLFVSDSCSFHLSLRGNSAATTMAFAKLNAEFIMNLKNAPPFKCSSCSSSDESG